MFVKYKPKYNFYNHSNYITSDNTQFWFPFNKEGINKRLEIAKEVLVKLQPKSN
jgi:hypothetical protein